MKLLDKLERFTLGLRGYPLERESHSKDRYKVWNKSLKDYHPQRGLFICYESAPGLGDTLIHSMFVDALTHTFPKMHLDVLVQHPFFYLGKPVNIIKDKSLKAWFKGPHNRKLLNKRKLAKLIHPKRYSRLSLNRKKISELFEQEKYSIIFCHDFFIEYLMQDCGISIYPNFSDNSVCPFKIRIDEEVYHTPIKGFNVYNRNRAVIGQLGLDLPSKSPSINLSAGAPSYTFDKDYLLLNPYASHPIKEWDYKSWVDLVEILHKELDQRFELVIHAGATKQDFEHQRRLKDACDGKFTCLPHVELDELGKLLKNASLCVTVDTGLSHMASALETTSVILFNHLAESAWVPPLSVPLFTYRESPRSIADTIQKELTRMQN